jgi:hypothetical protein
MAAVRLSVSLPAGVAAQVRSLAKARRLSANQMLLELIEHGMRLRSASSGSSSTSPPASEAPAIRKR